MKLYKPFEHWYNGGTIYVYSDPHFDDPDCKIIDPNWPSSEDQVKMINKCVGKKDTIIFLGDIGNEDWIKYIKGYKVLLLGNHDKGRSNYIKIYRSMLNGEVLFESESEEECHECSMEYFIESGNNRLPTIRNNGLFDEIYDGPLFISDTILLSHEPIDLQFGVNIHGHCHNDGSKFKFKGDRSVDVNVCADVIDYTPIRLDKLIEKIKFTDIHRVAIDRAVKKAKKNG